MNKEGLMRAPRPKKKRILVVEDLDDERNLLRLALGEYDVAAVGDYDTGLRMARRQYFDLMSLLCWAICIRRADSTPGNSGCEEKKPGDDSAFVSLADTHGRQEL